MINKKSQQFLEKFDASTMENFVQKSKLVEDILSKCNSQIIRDLLLNARDYHHTDGVISTLGYITSDDEYVMRELERIGYKVSVEKTIGKSGEWNYIKIKFK